MINKNLNKLLNISAFRDADAYTIKNKPIASIDLIEYAATQCYQYIKQNFNLEQKLTFSILCGGGNNGGDGLVIARLLSKHTHLIIKVILINQQRTTKDFEINLTKLKQISNIAIIESTNKDFKVDFTEDAIIIDAIFGSGLNRIIEDPSLINLIEKVNLSNKYVIAIDIPSGLLADQSLPKNAIAIKANTTLTFHSLKRSFLFPEHDIFLGKVVVIDIGLLNDFFESYQTTEFLLNKSILLPLKKDRAKFAHKGTFGHGLLICGSYGKMGAAILSSKAALRTGIGLLTVHVPAKGVEILQTSLPEAMCSIDPNPNLISRLLESDNFQLNQYSAIGIGCGIGKDKQTMKAFTYLLEHYKKPILIDADAINILSENRQLIDLLPEGSILTPHLKEFNRLIDIKLDNHQQRIGHQLAFSKKYKVFIVLKGAYSHISTPDGYSYFNTTGNPGMATAGSGDVLSGIIFSLLSQNYSVKDATLMGVYLHGMAGDFAKQQKTENSMIASDIIDGITEVFKEIHHK